MAAEIGCREQTIYNWYSSPRGPEAAYLGRLLRLLQREMGWSFERGMDELVPK